MINYFETVVNEIQLLLANSLENQAPKQGVEKYINRQLSTFRLPILLVPLHGLSAGDTHNPVVPILNPYFSMVFSSFEDFTRDYPELMQQLGQNPRDFTAEITIHQSKRLLVAKAVLLLGQPYLLVVVNYRVEYAQLLKQREKFLLIDLVHKANDFIGLADENGNFVFINEAGLRLLHLSPTDVHLLNVWDLHNHKELFQILKEGRQEDGSFSWIGQAQIKTSDDQWRWCSISITTHLSDGARFYATVIRDLSMLKRIEEQLAQASSKIEAAVMERSSDIIEMNLQLLQDIEASERMRYMVKAREERLTSILDTSLDGFFVVDLNLRVDYVNQAFKDLVGATYKDLDGERMLRFFDHDAKAKLRYAVKKVMSGDRLLEQVLLQGLDGTVRACTVSFNPYHSQGRLVGIFGFVRPII